MIELILEILKKLGYEEGEFKFRGTEILPLLRYKIENEKIELFILPSKEIYIFDLLESLRKYFKFSIVFRGFRREEIERASFEKGKKSFSCFFEGEEVIRGEERILGGMRCFFVEIFKDKLKPRTKKILILLKDVKYSDIKELVLKIRERNIVVLDEGRRFEKEKSVGEKKGFDIVIFINKSSLETGEVVVYDPKLKREKIRKLSEILNL